MKRRSRAGGETIKGRRGKTPEPERRNAPKSQTRSKLSPTIEETEVARLTRELTDERRQRLAMSEVLRLLSGSHGDLNHLFDTILANATNLCQANFGTLSLCEGDAFRIVAMHNVPPGLAELRRREPLVRAGPLLRLAETKRLLHIADYTEYVASHPADSDAAAFAKLTGVRTLLEVPMLNDDDVVGAIVIYRTEVRSFDDQEIALVKDFAAQAVIAIENARLLNELRQSLEQQTATANVLDVISRSAFDLHAVFKTVAQSSVRLCRADRSYIFRFDGEILRMAVAFNSSPEFEEWIAQHPIRPGRHSASARAALEHRTIHIHDVQADPEFTYGAKDFEAVRTVLAVPILKGADLLGVMILNRFEVRPFSDQQIALVETFADQAAIAIENVRLLDELRQRTTDLTEALEQQTATSEVLQVISGSPGDLQPVFAAMLKNAARICEARYGVLYLYDGQHFSLATHIGAGSKLVELMKRGPITPHPSTILGRIARSKEAIEIEDARKELGYLERHPVWVAGVEEDGALSLLGVPMLKEGALVGAFVIFRQEVKPFTEKQTELVKNFAAQAVIAIENARLLNELRRSLEQQTGTADILRVISQSPTDARPVFDSIVATAVRLLGSDQVTVMLRRAGCLPYPSAAPANVLVR
jgi:two-component system, NtrC family, sensor kinase